MEGSRRAAPRRPPELPDPFELEILPERERVRVVPCGELDVATVDQLRSSVDDLVAAGFDAIVLDLRRLAFMDSTGVCLIVEQTRRTDATVRLFDLIHLRETLPFVQPHELQLRG